MEDYSIEEMHNINDKILVISDFDFTLNNKFNYTTGQRYESSYGIYDKSTYGEDQEAYDGPLARQCQWSLWT